MKRNHKRILLFGIVIPLVVAWFYIALKDRYRVDFPKKVEHDWLFQPEYLDSINSVFIVKKHRKYDEYTSYLIGDISIGVSEINGLVVDNVDRVRFYFDCLIDNPEFYPAHGFNDRVKHLPTVRTISTIPPIRTLQVCFDPKTMVDTVVKGGHFVCYQAIPNMVYLTNEEGREVMLFTFKPNGLRTLILFLEKDDRLFIVTITSSKDIELGHLRLFNSEVLSALETPEK